MLPYYAMQCAAAIQVCSEAMALEQKYGHSPHARHVYASDDEDDYERITLTARVRY
jgi:hypothetical protein